MQLNLTIEQEGRMVQMCHQSNSSFEEIVRKAISMYEMVHKLKKENYKFGIVKENLFYDLT